MKNNVLRRVLISTVIGSVASLSMITAAFAHQGFSQTANPIVAIGDHAYTELLFGNHSNEHKSYRIDGNWGSTAHKTYVYTPDGQKLDISETEFYTGEVGPTFANQNKNNSYYVTFASQLPGAYVVNVESDTVYKGSSGAKRTVRSAKSFVAVSDLAVTQRVANLKGFEKAVTTDRAEWVPTSNPLAAYKNKSMNVQLILKGKPLANVTVDVIRRTTKEAVELKTDPNGMIRFTPMHADFYLFAAKPEMLDEKKEGEYDSTSYEATMTIQVVNKPYLFTEPSIALTPHIYLDGRKLPSIGVYKNVKDGKWYVPEDVVAKWTGKKAVKKTTKNAKKVDLLLNDVLAANGWTLEELAAVGPIPATWLLQLKK